AETAQHLDTVLLFRRPMLDWWAEGEMPFEDLVRHLLIHEIGHHFGFSDADMERIEQAADKDG
ncbi:MAG TPA: metallopeptidase family protein, partial [Dongiaceae bacterium]